ncbi:Polymer-forming protein [Ectothiorhodosinus mongolicus]|uniref:Polymer-forming protein n=1 Tax=Ectothiorhodosinus mongolicus TaxID=233100 RepID=A0A1R3VLZ4_9GAMM|nr:polymer-forming cytoskeletal protein [Ectothiorhodosinus mongolicus]ULX57748.1 hypothetical protein CKX93_08855 [Ectothiorhodosinus mongolicus]SIT65610.1 Polymer-forming protein [Ectothiorhodosinus mongolicus]
MSATEKGNLVIGQGAKIKGDIQAPGMVTIAGTVTGKLRGKSVQVTQSGRVEGELHGDQVEIEGIVSDAITAKQNLRVRASAQVMGNVHYGSIEIQNGARIDGQLIAEQKARS